MYLFMKPKNRIEHTIDDQFHRHECFKLPTMCRITMLNIENDSDTMTTNCCRNLSIFDDFQLLNSSDAIETNSTEMTDNNQTETTCDKNDSMPAKCSDLKNIIKTDAISDFFECKVTIKGFRDQLIKGQSIWMIK